MIFLSYDPTIFYPRPKPNSDKFIVHYHGSYSPIQGVRYIVEAAKLLEQKKDIEFNIVGKMRDYQKEIKLSQELELKNINFIDEVPYEKVAEQIALADVCLGMFGDTEKALHCSAFKVIEGMAMKKPVITGDTPALRELITDKEDGLLCRMADAQDLADKILEVKNNPELKEKIAAAGYQFCLKHLTSKATGAEFKKVLESLISKKS